MTLSSAVTGGPLTLLLTPQSKPFCLLSLETSIGLSCQSPAQTMTVSNTGQTPSGTLSVALDATNPMASVFQLGGTCAGASLNPGDSCTIAASFSKPINAAGDYSIVVKLQPQLGDLYEVWLLVSGCP